jgi:DNA-binding CsgD family transcriptional regulator
MATELRRTTIIGRDNELAAGDRFLDALATGPAALLIEGEAGIGKTTIWSEVRRRAQARGYVVLATEPVESETELPFAGLLDLAAAQLDVVDGLPPPQRRALEIATARAEPGPTETVGALAIAAGFLSLLTARSAEAPVVVAVDDLQWLDGPTQRVVAFAVRRLGSIRVGVLASVRTASPLDPSVPVVDLEIEAERVVLGPLSVASLYHLIDGRLGESLPRYALTRIEATSGGNPIAALEMARLLIAGGPAPEDVGVPVPDTVIRLVSRRLDLLPEKTRDALLAAAALARPTTDLVPWTDLEPAVEEGLVTLDVDGRIRFTHPLFARAVYSAASPPRRARVHAALAERVADPDEQTLHAALASPRRDGSLAWRLHEVAERARRKGAPEFAAELEERAAARTPPEQAAVALERRLRAAEHHERAGSVERATTLAREVIERSAEPALRARARWLIAEIAFGRNFPSAIELLEASVREPGATPETVAQVELHLAFAQMAMLDLSGAMDHIRRAEANALGDPAILAEVLGVRAYIEAIKDDHLNEPAIRKSLELEDPNRETPVQQRPILNAGVLQLLFGRLDEAEASLGQLRTRTREAGEEHELPFVSNLLALASLLRGDRAAAEARIEEARRTAIVTGSETMHAYALAMRGLAAAFAGDATATVAEAAEAAELLDRVDWAIGRIYVMKTRAFLALSRDDFDEVGRQVGPVAAGLGTVIGYGGAAFFVEDLVDAWLATGSLDGVERLVTGLEAAGRAVASPMATVIGLRGRALLESARGRHDAALATIDDAEREMARLPVPMERGRTLLARGQILRRVRRKRDARDAFLAARRTFEAAGMALWIARADAELERVGLRHGAGEELTETERRIAELAAAGLTNRQIAAEAFVSPKTVEDVIGRVYGKLGIRSRAELGARMRSPD